MIVKKDERGFENNSVEVAFWYIVSHNWKSSLRIILPQEANWTLDRLLIIEIVSPNPLYIKIYLIKYLLTCKLEHWFFYEILDCNNFASI